MYPTQMNGYENDRATEFSDQLKASLALEATRDDNTVQEFAAKRQLHPTQANRWKRQAVEGMASVFSDKVKRLRTRARQNQGVAHKDWSTDVGE